MARGAKRGWQQLGGRSLVWRGRERRRVCDGSLPMMKAGGQKTGQDNGDNDNHCDAHG
jgi:hypothetical protein